MQKALEKVALWGFSAGLAPSSLGLAPIVKDPGGM